MESIKLWFQDWSDACEYANECVPDLSFINASDPLPALVSIAAVCFALWWWNERSAGRRSEAAAPAAEAGRYGELERLLDRAKALQLTPKKAA